MLEIILASVAVLGSVVGYAVWAVRFPSSAPRLPPHKPGRRVKIRDAQPGEIVTITGTIVATGEPLNAPISGRPCVFYQVTIQEHHGRGSNWIDVIRHARGVDFLLEDPTGRALVRGSGMTAPTPARLELVTDDPPPVLAAFLKAHAHERIAPPTQAQQAAKLLQRFGGDAVGDALSRTPFRYAETIFEAGATLSVTALARFTQSPDPENAGTGYRDAVRRLVLESHPDTPLHADDNASPDADDEWKWTRT